MSHYVFVPLTDELLYDHPDLICGPIRPYQPGERCHHWLSVELNPRDNVIPLRPRRKVDQESDENIQDESDKDIPDTGRAAARKRFADTR